MNHTLAQLAHRAGITVNAESEKFAELIVRECADICQDIDGEDNIDARSGRQGSANNNYYILNKNSPVRGFLISNTAL